MRLKFRDRLMNIFNLGTTITHEKVIEKQGLTPKRICLKTCHSNSLREIDFDNNDAKWALFIPFSETIKKIFEKETELIIYRTSKGRYWCPIEKEEDYNKALKFKEKYNSIVFLRDNLDLSVSLSEHYKNEEERTETGELEYQAKYQGCEDSILEIVDLVSSFIETTPFFKDTNYICAIPSSNPSNPSLPNRIAEEVSEVLGLTNVSDHIAWKGSKEALKEKSIEEKWIELEKVDIEIKDVDLSKKNIILIDDLYQSGTTIQFVAMKLKEFGATKIFGLTIVKSRKDSDNT